MSDVTMTSNEFRELKDDIKEIKKHLLGNGRKGVLDRVNTLEVEQDMLKDVPEKLSSIEVNQRSCPGRINAETKNKSYRVQIVATIIMAVSAAAMIIGVFLQ